MWQAGKGTRSPGLGWGACEWWGMAGVYQVPTESQVPGPRGELCTWACLAAPMAWICLFPAERGTLGILDLLAAESCGSAAVPSLPPLCPAASQHGNVEGPDPVWEGAWERHPSAEPYQTFTPMP